MFNEDCARIIKYQLNNKTQDDLFQVVFFSVRVLLQNVENIHARRTLITMTAIEQLSQNYQNVV